MRGDDSTAPVSPTGSPGTPPRARGRPGPSGAGTGPGGNTPACAGTTGSGGCASPGRTEHPRVRGDDTRVTIAAPAPVGTPPRARGRLETVQHPQQRARNTPACAGTTPPRASPTASGAEHPRVRGDDGRISGRSHPAPGTPRVRGDDNTSAGRSSRLSGTPPRARGRRRAPGQCSPSSREHPRVRGDDDVLHHAVRHLTGTPPRARGRHDRAQHHGPVHRNTPACAGTTLADLQLYVRQREDSFSGSRSALEMPVHGFKWRDKRVRSSTVPVVGGWRVESRPAGITGGSVCSCVPGAPLAGGQDPGSNDHGGWPGSRGGQPALGPGAAGRVRRPLHRDVACSTTGHCRASRRGAGRTRRRRARRPRCGRARTGGRCAPAAGPPSPSPAATRC